MCVLLPTRRMKVTAPAAAKSAKRPKAMAEKRWNGVTFEPKTESNRESGASPEDGIFAERPKGSATMMIPKKQMIPARSCFLENSSPRKMEEAYPVMIGVIKRIIIASVIGRY